MSDTTLTESDVESYALEILQELGYTYLPSSALTRKSDEAFCSLGLKTPYTDSIPLILLAVFLKPSLRFARFILRFEPIC